MQEKANKLNEESRKLRRLHDNVIKEVVGLMNIDILKNKNDWENKLSAIREMVDKETKSRPEKHCAPWLKHINYQIYKALEFQYRMGLETLNQNLSEIQADLVYKNQKMEFRPSFEQLKQKYYTEIQNFITIPNRIKGVGPESAYFIFQQLPENNTKYMHSVYIKAEELFSQVGEMVEEYDEWTTLGAINFEEYIEKHFTAFEDWQVNFNMIKQKRTELKKLPDSRKQDCININLLPFKQGIDDLFKRLSEALADTLQSSMEKDQQEVIVFVTKAQKELNSNP